MTLFLGVSAILLQIFTPPGFALGFMVLALFGAVNVGFFLASKRAGETFSYYHWLKINLVAAGGVAAFLLVVKAMTMLASAVPESVAYYFPAILITGLVTFALFKLFAFLR